MLRAVLVGLLVASGSFARAWVSPRYSGLPVSQVFTEREIPGSPQTRSVLAHPNGLIYIANTSGIVEYDGASWRRIAGTDGLIVHQVAADSAGRIWYSATGEFGLLAPDAHGMLQAKPLQERLPVEDRQVGHVLRMLVHEDRAYFVTQGKKGFIARADRHGEVRQIAPPNGERPVQLFVRAGAVHVITAVAAYRIEGDECVPAPEAVLVASLEVQSVWVRDRTSEWVVSAAGLRRWHGGEAPLVSDEVAKLLGNDRVSCGCPLGDGTFALGTEVHGVLIVDAESGRVLARYDDDGGLGAVSSNIVAMTSDAQGGLWLARFAGVTRIQIRSPVALHHGRDGGVRGRVQGMGFHRGRLHVATTHGVFVRDPVAGRFVPMADVPGDSWVLLPVDDGLTVGGLDLRLIRDDGSVEIIEPQRLLFRSAVRLRRDPDRLVACTGPGLVRIYRREAGTWRFEAELPKVRASLYPLIEDDQGWLWATRNRLEVVRLDWRQGVRVDAELESVGPARGLPVSTDRRERIWIFLLDGRVEATNSNGLWRHDPASDRFEAETRIAGLDLRRWARAFPLRDGSLWMANSTPDNSPAIARRTGPQTWKIEPLPYSGIEAIRPLEVCDDPDARTIWLGYLGLASFDREWSGAAPVLPEVRVRRVIGPQQKVLWDGAGTPFATPLEPELNSLRFEFAALVLQPDAFASVKTEYRSRLVGFSRDWSTWDAAAHQEYLKLPPGAYTFEVQARTAGGRIGTVAQFGFRLLPPWWRTWWCVSLAVLAAIGAIAAVTRWLAQRALRRRLVRMEAESAVERERLRLARDLHDEVGSGLGRVILFAGEADRLKDDSVRLSAALGRLRTTAQELVQHAREIVWAVTPQNDRVASLIERLGDHAEEVLRAAGIACQLDLDPDPPPLALSSEARHSLFLAVKEALHNSLKYSRATEVRLEVRVTDGWLTIGLTDNGCGFAPGERRGSGHGLRNIAARAEALGGRAEVESAAGKGTKVTLRVPVSGNGLSKGRAAPKPGTEG